MNPTNYEIGQRVFCAGRPAIIKKYEWHRFFRTGLYLVDVEDKWGERWYTTDGLTPIPPLLQLAETSK